MTSVPTQLALALTCHYQWGGLSLSPPCPPHLSGDVSGSLTPVKQSTMFSHLKINTFHNIYLYIYIYILCKEISFNYLLVYAFCWTYGAVALTAHSCHCPCHHHQQLCQCCLSLLSFLLGFLPWGHVYLKN